MSPRPADYREKASEEDADFTGHARAWHAEGEPETHDGETIHVRRRVGGAPLLLLLHGLPTSSFDWRFVLTQDREHAAVTFDYLGLGCSSKPAEGNYSLTWMADLADQLVHEHSQGRPVLIVAHDFGVALAAELIARDLEGKLDMKPAGAVLLNGELDPGERTREFVAGLLGGRLGGERRFRARFGAAFGSARPLSKEEAADQYSLLAHADGRKRAGQLLAYLDHGHNIASRRREAMREWEGPISAAWGIEDPVCGPEALERLRGMRPGLEVEELDGVGHYPQIEAPDRVIAAIRGAIAGITETKARSATR